jgi:hypothetical protein
LPDRRVATRALSVTESVLLARLIKESDVHSSEPQLCFASSKVENHPCIKCQAPMMLSRINTARLDFEVRTFECFNCDNLDKVTIETKRGSALSA